MSEAIEALIAAAEPATRRPLADLLGRLEAGGLLAGATQAVAGRPSVAVGGIAFDSRAVRPGNLFVAIPGEHVDGHAFVGRAATAGAVAALVEHVALGV